MKITIFQTYPKLLDKDHNIKEIISHINNAEGEVVVFPELATSGYNMTKPELKKLAETIPGPTTDRIKKIVKNKCVILGMPQVLKGKYYNSAAVITKEYVKPYQKIHLFNTEKKLFSAGNEFRVFNFRDVKLGVMICYDWMYPESARTLMLKGAQIIIHPTNLVMDKCPDAMITRSIENRVFTVSCGRVGEERGLQFLGFSQAINTTGDVLYRASATKIESFTVDLNPELAMDKDVMENNHIIKDRKKHLYK